MIIFSASEAREFFRIMAQGGLPPGCAMWYDQEPAADERHAKHLIRTMTKEASAFTQLYELARERNDAGFCNEANEARSRVEVARVTALDQSSKFEQKFQEQIDAMVGKVSRILESHPPFPEILSVMADEQAIPNFIQRIQNPTPPPFPDQTQFPIRIPRQLFVQPQAMATNPTAFGPIAPPLAIANPVTRPKQKSLVPINPTPNAFQKLAPSRPQNHPPSQTSKSKTNSPIVEQPETPQNVAERQIAALRQRYDEIMEQKGQSNIRYRNEQSELNENTNRIRDLISDIETQVENLNIQKTPSISNREKRNQTQDWISNANFHSRSPSSIAPSESVPPSLSKQRSLPPSVAEWLENNFDDDSVTKYQTQKDAKADFEKDFPSLRQNELDRSYATKATSRQSVFATNHSSVPSASNPVFHGPRSESRETTGGSRRSTKVKPPVKEEPLIVDMNPDQGINQVNHDLLRFQVASSAREFLVANRYKKEDTFNGDNDVDFESTLNRYQWITSQHGVDKTQAFMELSHYFTGSAGTIVALYENEKDPAKGIADAVSHLKREYGWRNISSQSMLDKVLRGGKLDKNDTKAIQKLRLSLEKIYKKAKDTGRAANFDTSDTINRIIRQRVPFVSHQWAKKMTKNRLEIEEDDDDDNPLMIEPTFDDFLKYLTSQSLIRSEMVSILGNDPKKNTRNRGDDAVINSIGVGNPKQSASRGGKSVRGGRGGGGRGGGANRGRGAANRGNSNAASHDSTSASFPVSTDTTSQPSHRGNQSSQQKGRGNRGFGRGGGRGGGGADRGNSSSQSRGASHGDRENGQSHSSHRGGGANNANRGRSEHTANSTPSAGMSNWTCPCCGATQKWHSIDKCGAFLKKPQGEKFGVLKSMGSCIRCLEKGHLAKNCSSNINCATCSGPHHTVMHKEKPEGNTDSDI